MAILFAAMVSGPSASWATEQSDSQVATLIGPRADAPIPLSLRPAANQPNVGYGMNGDSVTVIEQLASFLPEADPSTTWNHIRLNVEPYTVGWVQGKFLDVDETDGFSTEDYPLAWQNSGNGNEPLDTAGYH
ncbi:MAG: hypothetical protein AAFY17_15355 [Cyanobacteria bacterium J06642_11]